MSKFISSCLALVVFWQIIGFVGYFEYSHTKLKKEIKTKLKKGVPKEELIYFTFSEKEMNDLIWLKKNEFDLNGDLFDVVRKYQLKSGKFKLECISDDQEEVLFEKLGEAVSGNLGDDNGHNPVSTWFKSLKVPAVVSKIDFLLDPIYEFENSNSSIFFYLEKSKKVYLENETPPPILISMS